MKYLAAYALLSLSGKKDINADDVKKVLGQAQVNVKDEEINRLFASLKGKNIAQLITEGTKKLGGGGAGTAVAVTGPVVKEKENKKKDQPKKEQPKKEAPKKKQEAPKPAQEEEDFGLGGGLFD